MITSFRGGVSGTRDAGSLHAYAHGIVPDANDGAYAADRDNMRIDVFDSNCKHLAT